MDSSNSDDIVAMDMVNKLGLKRTTHSTPYKVFWLQKGHELLVDD